MTNREAIRQAINRAKRAQIDAQGGYTAVERDARALERQIDREAELAPQRILKLEQQLQAIEKERRELKKLVRKARGQNADLSYQLKLTRNRLYAARKRRDYWYSHATGHQPTEGRGAVRLRSVA